ncbi:MAG: undecaprenyl-phosphate glucose phosphotransferase [Ignavibacteriales bacterium]
MQIYRNSIRFIRLSTDIIFLVLCFILAIVLSSGISNDKSTINELFLLFSLNLVWIFSSKVTGLYDEFRSRNFSVELVILLKNISIQIISAIVILFFIKDASISRFFVLIYSSSLLISTSVKKYFFRKLLNYFRIKGRNLRNILIVGAGEVGMSFYENIRTNPHFGYRLAGFLDDEKKVYLNGKYLGPISCLDKILNEKKIDDVIIALPNPAINKIEEVVRICESHTTRVKIIPNYFNLISQKCNISMFGSFPIVSIRSDRLNELHWVLLKRTVDIILTLILFVTVFSWLFPLIALIIKINSSGPVLFKQERWTKNNKKFTAYKFRSMYVNCKSADENGSFLQATKGDPRITKIGKILRKTNLDELPQFLNVLKGEMSLVGPRPHPTLLNLQSKDVIDHYMLRHLVKPGITGWAQVNGLRGETKDPALMQKRIDHDLWYIENWTIWLDIQILFLTVWRMIKGDPYAY